MPDLLRTFNWGLNELEFTSSSEGPKRGCLNNRRDDLFHHFQRYLIKYDNLIRLEKLTKRRDTFTLKILLIG